MEPLNQLVPTTICYKHKSINQLQPYTMDFKGMIKNLKFENVKLDKLLGFECTLCYCIC